MGGSACDHVGARMLRPGKETLEERNLDDVVCKVVPYAKLVG
jgi:hypothetical protein